MLRKAFGELSLMRDRLSGVVQLIPTPYPVTDPSLD
jgi:hypothetical protein